MYSIDTQQTQSPYIVDIPKHPEINPAKNTPQFTENRDYDALKRQYLTDGNVINYVVGLLEAQNKGYESKYYKDLFNNLRTAIIEDPIGKSIGTFSFTNSWRQIDGKLQLWGHSEPLKDVYSRGAYDTTGQVPLFEIERNKYDLAILHFLTELRSSGSDAAVVKFSPTPSGWEDDPIIQSRGINGLDQICIFTREGNQEKNEILWFPQTTPKKYQQLLLDLCNVHPERYTDEQIQMICKLNPVNIDLDMLARFGAYSPQQIQIIRNFVAQEQQNHINNKDQILNYIENNIDPAIMRDVLPLIQAAALALKTERLTMAELEEIHSTMTQLQIQLRSYIAQTSGVNTFDNKTTKFLRDNNISHQDIISNKVAVEEVAQKSGYQMTGCGIGSKNKPKKSEKEWRAMPKAQLKKLNPKKYAELYIFKCPRCGHVHDIDVPKGQLVYNCKQCGHNANC